MQCLQCQFENGDTANFCEECGAKLAWTCPGCEHEVRASAKFCPECGTSLTISTPAPTPPRSQRPTVHHVEPPPPATTTPDAERRQLTVMFCDLIDSTKLSGQLDPEDLRDVIRAYQSTSAEVIERYDGHIAQHLGDGLMVYFGWPQAHEDDAQRAVHAGLGILAAMQGLNDRLEQEKDIRLAVRIGIHTGLVVVGEIGQGASQEHLALGETPNVASRIEGIAAPDTVAISGSTYQLVQGYVVCNDLGLHTAKGVNEPQHVYRVVKESDTQSRLDVAAARGLTPLVGRESESAMLFDRWQQVKDGQGQVVLLSGEAGIGKSRLLQVLRDHVSNEPHIRMECRSSPYYQNTALYPVTDLLQRMLRWQQDDTPEQRLATLEQKLSQYRLPLKETVPLFAALLSLPIPEDHYPSLNLSPQRQRQKILESIVTILLEQSEQQPLLFVLEDLHWLDPTSLELLDLLIDQMPTTPILILLTCRPTFQPTWRSLSYLTHMTLNRLSRDQIEQMTERVTGGKHLPDEVIQQLAEKTDGVPLYVEELTKAVLESEMLKEVNGHYAVTGFFSPLAIPSTLQDSLIARLDRLVTAKGIAQIGATIGRQFSYQLLLATAQVDEATLRRELRQLIEAELLYQRGLPPQATYTFKHALIQDAAYQSLLKSTRQHYHQRIAHVLETRFPGLAETQPELLAHHFTEAGLNEQAVYYWHKAGQRAIERSAHVEAITHLNKGLELHKVLPDTPEHMQQELALQTALGPAFIVTKGYAAPEVGRVYSRARQLCQHIGSPGQLVPVLRGLWRFYQATEPLRTAQEFAEQCLLLAKEIDDVAAREEAHLALGITLYHLGQVATARTHFEHGISLYVPQRHHSLAYLSGEDPGVVCHARLAHVLWMLGFPDQAKYRSLEAQTLAETLQHPYSLVYALNFASMMHLFRREWHQTKEHAEATIALATKQGFTLYTAAGTILRGWALAMQGREEEGIAQMLQGSAAHQATGVKVMQPRNLVLLAEVYGHVQQSDKGLVYLSEAMKVVNKTGERWYEAELHRLKGELLLLQSSGNVTEAETCFQKAVSVAQFQQAKSWELRAATSLARLRQSQGKCHEAHELLEPVYAWFTEGFDTADLKDAEALLQELDG